MLLVSDAVVVQWYDMVVEVCVRLCTSTVCSCATMMTAGLGR